MRDILIPRRIEGRAERWKIIIQRQIQQYIKNGSVGNLILNNTPIEILPDNLIKVGGNLYLHKSNIRSLGNLELVGGYIYLNQSKIESLGKLKSVGSYLDLSFTTFSNNYTQE